MKEYLYQKVDVDDSRLVSVIDEIPLWSAPFGLKLLDIIKIKPRMSVLDIGCGTGFPVVEISQRLGKSSRIVGIDPWEQALKRLGLKLRQYQITNVTAFKGVAENLPFKNHSFDLIVSNNGINNVSDIPSALAECRRVSRSGAQFVMTFNLEKTMSEFYRIFQRVLSDNGLQEEISAMKNHIHSKRKPLREMTADLRTAGFRTRKIWRDSFQLKYLNGSTMLDHYLIKYWFLGSWKAILKPEDIERVFHQVEERLNRTAGNNGEFRLTVPFVTIDCRRK